MLAAQYSEELINEEPRSKLTGYQRKRGQVCCCTILAPIVQYSKISVMNLNSSQLLLLRPRSLIATLMERLD